jgi:hypothetical protein
MSLRKGVGLCPDMPLTLDARNGHLVGRDGMGHYQCEDAMLVGATFDVEALVQSSGAPQLRRATIQITQAHQVRRDPSAQEPPYASYVLSPANEPSVSLCNTGDAKAWRAAWLRGALSTAPPAALPSLVFAEPPAIVPPEHVAEHALVISGDVFDGKAERISRTGPSSGWFNLACAGGALAKLKLDDLDPQPDVLEVRKATLKMVTARYCKGESYTVPGPQIRWVSGGMKEPTDPEQLNLIEARWNDRGATCLSHSRLWRPDVVVPILPEWQHVCHSQAGQPASQCDDERFVSDVRQECLIGPNKPLPTCDGPRPTGTVWTSYRCDAIKDPTCRGLGTGAAIPPSPPIEPPSKDSAVRGARSGALKYQSQASAGRVR